MIALVARLPLLSLDVSHGVGRTRLHYHITVNTREIISLQRQSYMLLVTIWLQLRTGNSGGYSNAHVVCKMTFYIYQNSYWSAKAVQVRQACLSTGISWEGGR